MTLVEIESAAKQLPQPELRQLVARLQVAAELQDQEKSSSAFQKQARQHEVEVWLAELQRIGKRIETKAADDAGPGMVELVSEGRSRCS